MKVKAEVTVLKHQEEFALSNEKFQAIVGGFGSGKSQADVFRCLSLLKRRNHAIVVVVAPTYIILNDVNIPDFQGIFDQYKIKYEYRKQEKKILINNGVFNGEIWFRSADKPERIVGFDATDFIIDEYDIIKPDKQRELWRKIIARIRGCKDGTGAVSTTPEGFRETYELFEKKKIGKLIRAKTTDNIFLPQDYIDTLYAQYDEMLVKQYIDAQFVNINGLQAYYGFSRGKNHLNNSDFEKKYHIKIKDVDVYNYGLDFNVNKMCCELFVHLPNLKRVHYFDEITLKNPLYSDKPQTQKMMDIILDKYKNKDFYAFPDATGGRGQTSAVQSDLSIIRKTDRTRLYVKKANPFVRDRLNAANKMLGERSITIDTDKCPELTEDFEKCERDQYGDIDKSDSERSHASDAGTYPIAYLYPIKSQYIRSVKR